MERKYSTNANKMAKKRRKTIKLHLKVLKYLRVFVIFITMFSQHENTIYTHTYISMYMYVYKVTCVYKFRKLKTQRISS